MAYEIKITYNDGARVQIDGEDNGVFDVLFYDNKRGELVHKDRIECGYWIKTNRAYYTEWKIVIYRNHQVVFDEIFNCENRTIAVTITSSALGDNIAWSPYINQFMNEHKCSVIAYSSHWELLSTMYPEIDWRPLGDEESDAYASYRIDVGIDSVFFKESINKLNEYYQKKIPIKYIPNLTFFDKNKHIEHPSLIPLQKIAANVLGLPFYEIRPEIKNIESIRPIEQKYVCISEFASSSGMKEWNNTLGWQTVVDWLSKLGYLVVSVSKEPSKLKNVIKRNGDFSIQDRAWYLKHADFFIGVSSGLSWLNWAVGKKTVMISGFTSNWYEFQSDNIRIINTNACHGCHNLEKHADKLCCYHLSFCPENKNFECTRKISPKMVMDVIAENFIN